MHAQAFSVIDNQYLFIASWCYFNDEQHQAGETWVINGTKFECIQSGLEYIFQAMACVLDDGTELEVNSNLKKGGKLYSCGFSEDSEDSNFLILNVLRGNFDHKNENT